MQQEDTLKRYINELVKLSKKSLPSQKSITELTRKYKLTEEEQHKLDNIIARHMERADIGMNHGNYHSALQELERASRLSPRDHEIYQELAQIYLTRYHAQGEQENDRLLAERSINRCLILNPKSAVAQLIKKEILSLDKRRRNSRKLLWILAIIIPTASIILILLFSRINIFNLFNINTDNDDTIITTPISLEDNRFPTHKILPLLQNGFTSNDLSLTLYKSEVVKKNDAFALQVQGIVETESDIERLILNMKLLDYNFDTMSEKEIQLVDGSDPILREGQSVPIDHYEYISEIPGDIHSIELSVSEAIMKDYVISDSPLNMDLFWNIGRPDGVRIDVEMRTETLLIGYDRMYWTYAFDFRNRGSKDITRLNLNCEFYDDSGNLFLVENWTTITTGSVPMKPGEERVVVLHLNEPLNKDFSYSDIALRVMDIETN